MPPRAEKTPRGAEEAPGPAELPPGRAEEASRQVGLAPGRGEGTLDSAELAPGPAEEAPRPAELAPGPAEGASGPAELTSHPAQTAPRRHEALVDSDPHSFITSAVQGGRHGDADVVAGQWEQAAVRAYGVASEEALHWAEVRADLAMFAGDPARSCRAWLSVAGTRLGAGQASDAPAVEVAVDRAHHQWTSLGESADARELGPVVVELRRRVPGRREGAVRHAERQLQKLESVQHVPG